MGTPGVRANGDLDLGQGTVVPSREVVLRTTTSGGPGGQHANRTMSRVVATIDLERAEFLTACERERARAALGPRVSASAAGSRSQAQNKHLALLHLAHKLAGALEVPPPRTATRPTRASKERRLEAKRRRGERKVSRRATDD